ncbi:MAG: hypothetical protein J7J86_00195 [Bacteroidales bacterium]|nr:hypothetical protein [Bacteroidales bacterium]
MFREFQNISIRRKYLNKNYRNILTDIINNNHEHWKWRYKVAEYFSKETDLKKYGLKAIYLIGSTKNACAGPASDIDLLVHCDTDCFKKSKFLAWVKKWSYTISYIYKENGDFYINDGLIDLHIITDEDIKNKTSFAVMIGAITDPARLLKS